jgi:hypothetical protein
LALITYDIEQLYQRTFGTRPVVPPKPEGKPDEPDTPATIPPATNGLRVLAEPKPRQVVSANGRSLSENYLGTEVWLPVRLSLFGADELEMPYSVVRATCKKHIVSTPLAERQGTVKELYSADDWQITVKGFLIAKNGNPWPEADIEKLNRFFRLQEALVIKNPLTDILLENQSRPEEQCRVVMESLELMEVEGGRTRVQGFSMKLLSDSVFTLEVE